MHSSSEPLFDAEVAGPNFLIVGAAKSGTTSLYYWLDQHPDIFFSEVKEPCFLCYAGGTMPSDKVGPDVTDNPHIYRKLFEGGKNRHLRGEATAIYLYLHERTISNIKAFLPSAEKTKIIMVLRNPVDRAFSQYMMNIRDLRETLSFEEAIEAEAARKQNNLNSDFFYLDRGFYYAQVKDYLENFSDVKVYLFEDLLGDPRAVVDDMLDFLGARKDVSINMEETFNVSGRPKFPLVNKLLLSDNPLKTFVRKVVPRRLWNSSVEKIKNFVFKKNLSKEKLDDRTRAELIEVYREDVGRLATLLNRNLDHWLK
ncbi:MAG: sulfotransferase [Pseudomonadales bacterium]|nr:sulfotransferase [Pseudomonadales bacterium]